MSQVDARDTEVTQLRDERDTLNTGFNDVKNLLRQSMEERTRLAERYDVRVGADMIADVVFLFLHLHD